MARVLVAYGSERGGTAEIAEWIGVALRDVGVVADVVAAALVRDVGGYDAVIVGGSVYGYRWHRDARRLVRRYARALGERPVWLFSSGPLDNSANEHDIPPVRGARRAAERVHAREHITFGGVLRRDAKGFPAAAMAERIGGDYRDPALIRAWATAIAEALKVGVDL